MIDFINNNEHIFNLCLSLVKERGSFLPEEPILLRSIELTPNPKVVILGQDPYPNKGEANGLSFGTNSKIVPRPLLNIIKELKTDLNVECQNLSLEGWAKQGVLLLNTVLTVEPSKASSHFDIGWEVYTDNLIKYISDKGNVIFVLWGNKAKLKKNLINDNINYIIETAHPSPLSANRGFFGSKPFSKVNDKLNEWGLDPIDWSK